MHCLQHDKMISLLRPYNVVANVSTKILVTTNCNDRMRRNYATANSKLSRNVVLIDGVRTPFLKSYTDYKDMLAYELQRHAVL